MNTKYGSPYLYPGLDMVRVNLQIKEERNKKRQITFEQALDATMLVLNEKNATDYKVDDVKGRSRKRELVEIRSCAGYILYSRNIGTLKSIGRFFGGRDHSTVINGNQNWANLIECYPVYRRATNKILSMID
jgi:chromosomal replication initiator protein